MRVLILDTEPFGKLGLVRSLSRVSGMTPVLERDLAEGTWSKSGAAVILVSANALQGRRQTIAGIKRKFPRGNILILGSSDETEAIDEFVRQGADGYLKMVTGDEALVNAINVVARGGFFLPGAAARAVVSHLRATPMSADALTADELQMLQMLEEGLTNREMAERTGLNEATIKTRMRQLCRRFRVRTRVQVLMHATRRGLLHRG
jgi:DNA-binding NarL/FixJ family response regulator